MINYKKYKRHRKKLSKKSKIYISVFVIAFVIVGIFSYLGFVVNPIIITASKAKIVTNTETAVSQAIYEVIKDENLYNSLIDITKNDQGDVVLISTNSMQINRLTQEIYQTAQNKIDIVGEKGVDIPLGTFCGLPIFNGLGPNLNIKLTPIGNISTRFESKFVTGGINQTVHKIVLNVLSSVEILLPTSNYVVETNSQVLLCESVIVGKVPEFYLNTGILDDLLNLIP